jgi:hypothetical protein
VPWIGTYVIITKLGNTRKGYVGIVKDVLRGQDTASGLKIAIQLQHLDPSAPFKTTILDHDDVVVKGSVNNLFCTRVKCLTCLLQGLDLHF